MFLPRLFPASLFATLCLSLPDAVRAQTVVRVLSYNIERSIGASDSNTEAQPALAKIVNYLKPDVWTISELGGNSPDFNATTARTLLAGFISSRLTIFGPAPQEGQNYFIYVGQRNDGYSTVAIVSRYPFLSTQTYSDAGGGFSALRGMARATVDLPGPTELGVFTTHLKAFNETSDASRRQAEANADAANAQSWLAAQLAHAAVITGDWNETEETSEADNWSDGDVGDTLPSGGVYRPVSTMRGTEFGFPLPVSIAGRRSTISSSNPTKRFDYVLHRLSHLIYLSGSVFDTKQHSSAQLASLNSSAGTSFTAADSAAASDHLPVLETFLATPGPALIASQSLTGLASTAANLNAAINPNGLTTNWWIELGATTSYGASSSPRAIAAGTASVSVSLSAAGLSPATTYRFRVVTQNSSGISYGADQTFTTAAFVDSDGDGLPNDFETAHGLNPQLASDALLDTDGDGRSNRDEFLAGTDPRSAASVLRIVSIDRDDTGFVVTFSSVFGKRYRLEQRETLDAGDWGSVQENIGGTGALMPLTDEGGLESDATRFYRVVVP